MPVSTSDSLGGVGRPGCGEDSSSFFSLSLSWWRPSSGPHPNLPPGPPGAGVWIEWENAGVTGFRDRLHLEFNTAT